MTSDLQTDLKLVGVCMSYQFWLKTNTAVQTLVLHPR